MTLPELHRADWRPTKGTLHLYCQIVGKVRLASTPPRSHWWNAVRIATWFPGNTTAQPAREREESAERITYARL